MKSQTVLDPLLKIAKESPGNIFAEVWRGQEKLPVTFGELAAQIHGFAAAYRRRGLRKGTKIVFLLPHHPCQYSAYLGAMAIGALPAFLTPLNRKLRPDVYWPQQRRLFDQIKPDLIVTDVAGKALIHEHMADWEPNAAAIEDIEGELISTQGCPAETHDIALIQYSSGTTGPRKAVAFSHQAVLAQVENYSRAISLDTSDRIASWLPLYHDMGLITSFLLPVVKGVPVVALDPLEWVGQPSLLLDAIQSFKATLCWMPNFAFHHMARGVMPDETWALHSTRMIVNCSEPCRQQAFDAFLGRFGKMGIRRDALSVSYAMAENVFAVTQTATPVRTLREVAPEFKESNILSSGHAIDGVEIKLTSEDRTPVDDLAVGEIAIRSGFCIQSYFEQAARAVDSDGWYYTNDLGVMVDGELFVLGRKDDVIISRGKNIFAGEIEASLAPITDINPGRCICLGVYSETAGTQRLIIIAETTASEGRLKEIRREIAAVVETNAGMAPAAIYFVDPGWIVKTSSGKLDRSSNTQKAKEQFLSESCVATA